MKKFLAAALALSLALTCLAGCGGSSSSAPASSAAPASSGEAASSGDAAGTVTSTEKFTLKLAHPNPENHVFHAASLKFKEEVEARTNGNVTVEVYPNNQLGDSKEIVQSVSLGAVELNISSSAQFSTFNPELEVLDLPFLFATRDDAYAHLDGEPGAYLAAPLEEKNIKVLGYLDGGYRSMFNSKRPLVTPDDFKGLAVRVQDSEVYMDMMSTLGALPSFLPWGDLFVSIQQGVVDAGESGIAQIYSQRFYEVAKYISLTQHTFTANMFVISKSKWDALPADYQQAITEAAKIMIDYEREEMVKEEETSMEALKEAGAEINTVDAAVFQEAVAGVWDRFAEKRGQELIDLFQK